MLGLWDYSKVKPGDRYGEDDVTYEKGMAFLADCPIVEDWGCGTGYSKNFCKGIYRGVDGSKGPHTDVIADLREYRSDPHGIFMRHVLEHNHDWAKVLENALASFKKKMALILFTPFQPSTRVLTTNAEYHDVPDIGFRKEDITGPLKGLKVREEVLRTKTQYGIEFVFYIER